jgi:DNA (cytosine-5)-methyltransferase 1
MARIIHEVRPRFVYVENSPMLTARGLGTVLGDLASMGFDARWGVLGAADVGAPHQRDRIWIKGILAHPEKLLCDGSNNNARVSVERKQISESGDCGRSENLDNANSTHEQRDQRTKRTHEKHPNTNGSSELAHAQDEGDVRWDGELGVAQEEYEHRRSQTDGGGKWWQVEPDLGRVADGVAARVDRLKAIGNGQVPEVARRAWQQLIN